MRENNIVAEFFLETLGGSVANSILVIKKVAATIVVP
jgi:hypothetical protein